MKTIYKTWVIILCLIILPQAFPQKKNTKGRLNGEQQIDLPEGYSFISSRIIPENPNMMDVLQYNLAYLDFVRNSEGFMLRKIGPIWVNSIGDWITTEGYLFKMNSADVLIISGDIIGPQTPIALHIGYQMISLLPDIPVNTADAFAGVLENLDFVRNTGGYMFRKIGPVWVNSIGDMQAGEGYLVKMNNDDILIYPITNLSPNPPSFPNPEDGAENQSIEIDLSWTCTDPEGDPLTYDIYFGTEAAPTQVATGQTETTYDPGILEINTEYFWKIIAHDDHSNTTQGTVWNFTTGDEIWECGELILDERDGQFYETVQIGEQCWLAENMNIGIRIDGIINQSLNADFEKYCFDDNPDNCDLYGGLYQWNEMMQYVTTEGTQGICPEGWHIPSDDEWKILEGTVDSQYPVGDPIWNNTAFRGYDAGYNLKSTNGWENNGNGSDAYGFTGLPGGFRSWDVGFFGWSIITYFWSSSEIDVNNAWGRGMENDNDGVSRYNDDKLSGFSVRCINGEYIPINLPPEPPSSPFPEDGSENQSTEIDLSWTCTDPEGGPLTYDIYFGTEAIPPQVATGQTETTYDPETLQNYIEYFWKIIAHDDHENTTEGPVWSFITTEVPQPCPGIPTVTYEGQVYNTVLIGEQCWLKENLNVGIMVGTSWGQSNNGIIEKFCYNNDPEICEEYGGLYQWNEMMQYTTIQGVQGICPADWHIPTDDEWKILEGTVDSQYPVGDPEWDNIGPRGYDAGTNLKQGGSSGLEALLAGARNANSSFDYLGSSAHFWSSSTYDGLAWFRYLGWNVATVYRTNFNKLCGFSVRCLKNETSVNLPPEPPSSPNPEDGAENQSIEVDLLWTCTDPEGDPLTYDIYFGTEAIPPQVATGQIETTYDPGTLEINTEYFWKIVAHDDHSNTTEGPVWSFITETGSTWQCGDPYTDPRDEQTYETVQIGQQCWMAENLNIGSFKWSGDPQTNNGMIEKYCYNNNTGYCDTYGGLYQWNEMMQYTTSQGTQGICPNGWHLPTDSEWCILEQEVDPTIACSSTGWRGIDGGGKLKETGTTHWGSPNTGATNSSGFTALPGGYFYSYTTFYNQGWSGYFWTSSKIENYAWRRLLDHDYAQIHRDKYTLSYGNSVRCLHDETINQPPEPPSAPNPESGAENQSTEADLSWTCTDPESDPLTYEIYFGIEATPPLVATGQTETTYDPGTLENNTEYFWKIIAHDDHSNTTEGIIWSFITETGICGDPFTDPRDGQTYETVLIGDQCWMAENINIGEMIIGSVQMNDNGLIEKYCYGNNPAKCDEYGGLYQWNEMMQYVTDSITQGICPVGWHLPTDLEWKILEGTVDSQYPVGDPVWNNEEWRGFDAGKNLKSTTGWYLNGNGTNDFGFTALPSGSRSYYSANFGNIDQYCYFWSSSQFFGYFNWGRTLGYDSDEIFRFKYHEASGFSVRCLKDEYNISPFPPSSPNPENGSENQSIEIDLSWSCTDPEGDPLTYNIYFGIETTPPQVATGVTEATYDPGTLENNKEYFWKIVAHDDHNNTTEGAVWSFTTTHIPCPGIPTVYYEGRVYNTVLIGEQCWLKENLNIGTMINSSEEQTNNETIEKYCYENNDAYCFEYGGIYQWDEMMQYTTIPGVQGICPAEWHIPTDEEWTVISDFLGGTDVAGGKMKEAGIAHWSSPNTGATNESGFTALPNSFTWPDGLYGNLSSNITFWSSSEKFNNTFAWERSLGWDHDNIIPNYSANTFGFSVRCLKDDSTPANQPPDPPSSPNPEDGAENQSVETDISWICTDPEGDPLTYDVYFGPIGLFFLVSVGQVETFYDPGTLENSTEYLWRIVAHDDHGNITEGSIWSFITETGSTWQCGNPFTDTRDEQTYNTVQIDSQCWMSENLNIGTMIPGENDMLDNGTIEKYCYENDPVNCDEYGGLYQWNEMMEYSTQQGSQGICPSGWYIPTDEEWMILEGTVDSQYGYPDPEWEGTHYRGFDAGYNLKSTGGWINNGNGSDTFGFTTIPGGYRSYDGNFFANNYRAEFWSSTQLQNYPNTAWHRFLSWDHDDIYRFNNRKIGGYSVRCIKD
jgi:uncharacterized protein (TIGR02145 family)